MKTEAVIFDWAGTTVDYGCFAPVAAFVETFASKGIAVELDEVRAPMGALKRDHIKQMLEMPRIHALFMVKHGRLSNEDDLDEMETMFITKLMSQLEEHTQVKPYVLETVKLLRSHGIKIGSTTGYTSEMLMPVAKAAREQGYEPDTTVTPSDTGGIGRPAPDMLEANLKQLGVTNKAAVIKIGDTVSDIEEGKNAGVLSVGVIEGSSIMGLSEVEYLALSDDEKKIEITRVQAVYEATGADAVILNLSEIDTLLKL